MDNLPAMMRRHALEIARAGIAAVDPARLMRNVVHVTGRCLSICGETYDTDRIQKLIVIGAGKASAGMAEGFEAALDGTDAFEKLVGQVQIPEGIEAVLKRIVPLAVRPVGINEPTERAVIATQKGVELIASGGEDDLVVVLLSGGASALLSWPVDEIGLELKTKLIRYLSKSGATIEELNTVRSMISMVKGGGLLTCGKARMITLAISDVIGDPPHLIGSGPTVSPRHRVEDAIHVLDRYGCDEVEDFRPVYQYLREPGECVRVPSYPYHLIGTNKTAIVAAAKRAEKMGYITHPQTNKQLSGPAERVGKDLLLEAAWTPKSYKPLCWIYGGETTVQVPKDGEQHVGGRNQQIALSALITRQKQGINDVLLLSIGTDGEDGPTDAAGGIADQIASDNAKMSGLELTKFLETCNAYYALERIDSLIQTGPTGTNVMDLVVVLKWPEM
ncbi:glycerate kinase type-2 family protein [Lacunimicrobium album]